MGFYNPQPVAGLVAGNQTINGNLTIGQSTPSTQPFFSHVGVDQNFAALSSGGVYTFETLNDAQNANPALNWFVGITTWNATQFNVNAPYVSPNNTIQFLGNAGGSADALTLTPSPAITAYATGAMFVFKATANNATTTPTLALSALAARTLVKRASTAMAASDLLNGGFYIGVIQAATIQIINPAVP